MGRIKFLVAKITQLKERDAERRAIAENIATVLTAPTLKDKKKAARKVEEHASRLAH